MNLRISEVQMKKSVRKANKWRQYEMGALTAHRKCATDLVDLWSSFVELNMKVPARHGRGSRITKEHINNCYSKFQNIILKAMLELPKGDEEE